MARHVDSGEEGSAMAPEEAAALWAVIRRDLREELGEAAFKSWIDPLTLVDSGEGWIRLGAPSRVLRDGVDALDCLVATFPAGTLSGAPKPRAIRLIDDLEPAARGVYGGVVGYFDLSGDADLAIAIRTACLRGGVASVQAGAGLVADSVPATEYQETRNKAAAALGSVLVASTLEPLATGDDTRR